MTKQEKLLFCALCCPDSEPPEETLYQYASPEVLGQLFYNRMSGMAYRTLRRWGALGKVNREFRNSLRASYEQNKIKNQSFYQCVSYVSDLLQGCSVKAAMLKGAYLCARFPEGCRTSNDIDLLVAPDDVGQLGKCLTDAGFRQGYIRNECFIPASRQEIIASKMTRGETVPYIKEVNLPFMKFLEVDINFSFSYQNEKSDFLSACMERVMLRDIGGTRIPALHPYDFFIHLCAHLHKEATTLPWIEMQRDMTLYKYCDIYLLLTDMSETEFEGILQSASDPMLRKICAYAVLEAMELFEMPESAISERCHGILANDPDLRFTVVAPKEKKHYRYQTESVLTRFFMKSRKQDLKEIQNEAS